MHQDPYPDLLTSATDGFGNSCTFEYKPLTAADYTKLATASFPQQEYKGPLYVVSNVAASNGIGGSLQLAEFLLRGCAVRSAGPRFPRVLRSGPGSTVRDGTAQRRSYRQDFPYIGAVINARRTQEPSGTVIIAGRDAVLRLIRMARASETRSLPFASTIATSEREVGGTFNGALVRTSDPADPCRLRYGHAVRRHDNDDGAHIGGSQWCSAWRFVRTPWCISPTASFSNTPSPGAWVVKRSNAADQLAQSVRRQLDHAHHRASPRRHGQLAAQHRWSRESRATLCCK